LAGFSVIQNVYDAMRIWKILVFFPLFFLSAHFFHYDVTEVMIGDSNERPVVLIISL